MNYLAHLFLSDDTPSALVGGLLGDFVKGRLGDRYDEEIRKGIELHRKVDVFTDAHEIVLASKGRISPARRRFAGIIVDVCYDHFLARNWAEYSATPLRTFARRVYDALTEKRELLPDRLKQSLPNMIRNDWLVSYRELHVIDLVLNRISARLRRENSLMNAIEELESNYHAFEADFRAFFPDLMAYVAAYKKRP